MKKRFASLLVLTLLLAGSLSLQAAEPDYSAWTNMLKEYYDPAKGFDYEGLKKKDLAALNKLRSEMSKVNVGALSPKEQLAYWMNLYNISTVALIVDNYPTKSIRDLSTDPVIRLNVFKKPFISANGTTMSLNDVENDKIRDGFKDPRIHFAINCAAKSCPPMRQEAFVGARVDEQLEDQSRKFLNGSGGVRLEPKGDRLVFKTTKVMDWFEKDFAASGGVVNFSKKYLPADKVKSIDGAKKVSVDHYDYDWSLNDWKR